MIPSKKSVSYFSWNYSVFETLKKKLSRAPLFIEKLYTVCMLCMYTVYIVKGVNFADYLSYSFYTWSLWFVLPSFLNLPLIFNLDIYFFDDNYDNYDNDDNDDNDDWKKKCKCNV